MVNRPPVRIVGGLEAQIGDWGWQVFIYQNINGEKSLCGGSLINTQWIITAAHCVSESLSPANYLVSVGVHTLKNATNLAVSKVIMNSAYDDETSLNDLALLKLKNPIQIDNTTFKIVPICVPTSSARFQNTLGYATGWGTLSSGGSVSNVLMQVSLMILPDYNCTQSIYTDVDAETQVCAGIGNGKDTCQGDSGGPLVQKDSDGRWYLVGITSYGVGCGTNPGVYTRASAYSSWILSNLNMNDSNSIESIQITSKYNKSFITSYKSLTSTASLAFISNYKTFIYSALSSNPPSSIEVNKLFSGSVGVLSTLQFINTNLNSTSLVTQVYLAINNAPRSSSSLIGGLISGSLSVTSNGSSATILMKISWIKFFFIFCLHFMFISVT